jgi:CheY-like chemotaxis protein
MDETKFQDLLRLSDAERGSVLDRLDEAVKEPYTAPMADGEGRSQRRWSYRAFPIRLTVEHPGGGVSRYAVCGRNLGAVDMTFLHGGYLNKGSRCRLELSRLDGRNVPLTGTVAQCRLVHANVHDTCLQFDRSIDPTAFLKYDAHRGDHAKVQELPNLLGRLLAVDDTPVELQLLRHRLRATTIALTTVGSAAEASEALARGGFDIVLCDLHLGDANGEDVIRRMRESQFAGPIVAVTADTNPARISLAKAAGADHVLTKPYEASALLSLLVRLHDEIGAIVSQDQLYSSLEDQAGMEQMLDAYIRQARDIAAGIEAAMVANNFNAVRELCLVVRGSASGYGYKALSDVANQATQSLDATMSIAESSRHLRRLRLICSKLARGGSAGNSDGGGHDAASR